MKGVTDAGKSQAAAVAELREAMKAIRALREHISRPLA